MTPRSKDPEDQVRMITGVYVEVRLTRAQARALDYIISNSMDYPDVVESLFPDGRERKTAERAAEIIEHAVRVSYRKSANR